MAKTIDGIIQKTVNGDLHDRRCFFEQPMPVVVEEQQLAHYGNYAT